MESKYEIYREDFEKLYKIAHGESNLNRLGVSYVDFDVKNSWIWFTQGIKFNLIKSALKKLTKEEQLALGIENE